MMRGRGLLAFSVLLVLATITAGTAHAQSSGAPDRPMPSGPIASQSSDAFNRIAYCPDLRRVVTLALTKEKFGAIAGKPRHGDFFDTLLPLAGWKECSLYGTRTYTCDSRDLASVEEAAKLQVELLDEMKSCLGEGWAEDADRSSSAYAVLRTSRIPVAMTVSTHPNETNGYVVRLTLFLRSGG